MTEINYKQVATLLGSRGGKANAKKLGKKGLKAKMEKMRLAKAKKKHANKQRKVQ